MKSVLKKKRRESYKLVGVPVGGRTRCCEQTK